MKMFVRREFIHWGGLRGPVGVIAMMGIIVLYLIDATLSKPDQLHRYGGCQWWS